MAPKKWMVPISVNVNMANHVVHIYGDLKLQIEFCYGGGAGGPQWAPRLMDDDDCSWKLT